MRGYAKFPTDFWRSKQGRGARRKCLYTMAIAPYLWAGPESNMVGLYYMPVPLMAHELGLEVARAQAAVDALAEVGWAHHDPVTDTIWIPGVLGREVGSTLKPADNRRLMIERLALQRKDSPFFAELASAYAETYGLALPGYSDNCSSAPGGCSLQYLKEAPFVAVPGIPQNTLLQSPLSAA
jgi:hypothetical protein